MTERGAKTTTALRLETPLGSVSIEVNGEPAPFELEDATLKRWTWIEQTPEEARWSETEPIAGRPDKTWTISFDTAGLKVGDEVKIAYDFDSAPIEEESGERLWERIFQKDGVTLGLSILDDEEDDNRWPWAIMLADLKGSYVIVRDPAASDKYLRTVRACVCWRCGTDYADKFIVELPPYYGL